MAQPQTLITEHGDELVVLSRADYQALLASAAGTAAEAAEDASDVELARASRTALASGAEVSIPLPVWEEIEAAPHPLGPVRRWRGVTQADLAAAAGLAQPHISAIEAGRKAAGVQALGRLATALRVPIATLIAEG